MKKSAPISFGRGGEQVEDMMQQGMPFASVEDLIDRARLSWDHKAALWLLAWSLRDPVLQRQDARATLGSISGGSLATS
jgi:hypothetical protein